MKKRKQLITLWEALIISANPRTIYSPIILDKYKLESKDITHFAKDLNGDFIKPFTIISNANVGGIKLVYNITTIQPVRKSIYGISIPWFNKILNVQTKIFLCPLKKHWSQKLSYEVGGKSSSPYMNIWFVLNQNYSDIYKDQHYIELISEVENKQIIRYLNDKTRTFYINNKI